MAEKIAADVLTAVITDALKWVGATIICQFKYLCCFSTNIATLKDEAERLDDAAKGLQGRVDREIDNVQVIVPEVETWIKRSNHIKDEMNGILDEVPKVESGCLKLSARFSLSKRAKKTTDHMEELRGQCKFDVIAQPGPPPATRTVPLGTAYEFQSRKQIEEDIMTSLRGGDVNMIGICGMGGLGKTTMAKMIMNRALKDQLFDEVVMAVVSQPIDKFKIQLDIGEALGLKNLKEETSMANRVQMLHTRLTAGTKRILLVLDDVWERLMVEKLGIPRGCKGCTILVTSRNGDVLRAMKVENVFGMEVLPKEDAWFLFRETAGRCVDDIGLNSIGKEVVEECKGLPIALTTLGAALKDEKNKRIWKDTVTQLRKANPTNIPDFIKEVYKPLKVSYDKLDSKEAKSVFLLCSLFGEDDDIPLDYLTYFCMGLGIFEGGMEEVRNSMCTVVKMLKSRSLLLDGHNEDDVRMHDVVRDVCIFIAKEKGYIGGNDCTWISSFETTVGERTKLSTNLRLLFLSPNYSEEEEEIKKFGNSFVKLIRDLQVLCIERYSSLTSLPHTHTTESLRNLKTLILHSCNELETISFVGELVHLEILICCNCASIKELPPEMKRLNRLKLLDLTGCVNLERIGGGIISSLVGLEELKMLYSFTKWEAARDSNERENGNATVRELEALTNLRCLEIEIDDPALAAQNMRLSSKLDRFQIRIGYVGYALSSYSYNKKMSLKWEGETCVGEWIEMQLIRDAECLHLTGNGANKVAISQNIRKLELEECETIKNIGRTSMDDATVFPFINHLKLFDLPQLEEIFDGPISSNSFHNLNKLRLQDLPALKQLWKNSSSPVFHNLSSIHISNCPRLRNLGQFSTTDDDTVFPHMKYLELYSLPQLEEILDGPISSNSFHNLKELKIERLPALKQLWKSSSSSPVFHNLSSIEIHHCPRLRNLGQFSTTDDATVFPFVNHLELSDLPQLEEILDGPVSSNSFHNLKELHLQKLSALKQLWKSSSNPVLHNLSSISIINCPKLEAILDGPISSNSFHNLKELYLEELPALKQLWKSSSSPVFHNLSSIGIVNCPKLEEILDGPISSNSFHNLEKIKLHDLPALKQLWKSSSSPAFHKLSSIYIGNCPKLEEILDGPISSDSFHSLKELELQQLPALKQLWKSSSSSPVFHNLSFIYIYGCPCLRNLGQLSSVAENNCLSQLQTLIIGYCELMEQVFFWNEEDERRTTKLMFPKLKEVALSHLPNLVTLCQGIGGIEFPLLIKLSIEECPRMKSMVSSEENNCGGSRNADIDDYHSPHLFCQPQNVSFDSLKILTIQETAFYCKKIPVSFLNGLEKLTIFSGIKCRMSLFTSSIAQNFVSLRELRIEKCDEIVQVIKDEEEKEAVSGGERTLLFPKLEKLELTDLCKLESFCEWNCDVNCRRVKIRQCSNMKIFSLGSNVSFSFHGLEELIIANYEGIMSLFSSSITQNLVSLIKLEIRSCGKIVKVIEDEKEEGNVVSSGGAQTTTTILFPKLQELKLRSLSKLESFCEWKCDIELPSLRIVHIHRCSNMKIFTRGPQTTPNLQSVRINYIEYFESAEDDLNGALKQHDLRKQKAAAAHLKKQEEIAAYLKKQRKTTTDEDEDEETKSEIEDEQNSKTTTLAEEEEEGRKGEIEEEQNS